jgi:hypothetical protein
MSCLFNVIPASTELHSTASSFVTDIQLKKKKSLLVLILKSHQCSDITYPIALSLSQFNPAPLPSRNMSLRGFPSEIVNALLVFSLSDIIGLDVIGMLSKGTRSWIAQTPYPLRYPRLLRFK